jgi:hypothetical protein
MQLPGLHDDLMYCTTAQADGEGFDEPSVSGNAVRRLRESSNQGAAQSGAFLSDFNQNAASDPDLAAVIGSWPTLPAEAKRRIVKIVQSAASKV